MVTTQLTARPERLSPDSLWRVFLSCPRRRGPAFAAARPVFLAAFLCCLFLTLAGAARAGTEGEAAFDPNYDRIRKQIAATTRRVADQYIAEQASGRLRALTTLIVGALYETGQMGDSDLVVAAHYYRQAADMGLMEAKSALAGIYNQGARSEAGAINRDPAAARALYEEAAADGSVPAMLALGIIYADGMNVEPDSKKALSYLLDAAQRGDSTALDRLEPVMRKAREWEEAKPGRKGKSGFPTSKEEVLKPHLVQAFIDRTFDLDRLASATYVELSKRISEATR